MQSSQARPQSAHEIARLRKLCGPGFKLVVPGIRPVWAASGDQKRVMTPAEAVRATLDRLVASPEVLALVQQEIQNARAAGEPELAEGLVALAEAITDLLAVPQT